MYEGSGTTFEQISQLQVKVGISTSGILIKANEMLKPYSSAPRCSSSTRSPTVANPRGKASSRLRLGGTPKIYRTTSMNHP